MGEFDATVGILVVVNVAAQEAGGVADGGERKGGEAGWWGEHGEVFIGRSFVDGTVFVEDGGHGPSSAATES